MNQIEVVGADLAEQVAQWLSKGSVLMESHRDYCGIGLYCVEGAFVHIQVGDWGLPTLVEALGLQASNQQECKVFLTKNTFTEWLAGQSDESLSGRDTVPKWYQDNQRLTVYRLKQFVAARAAEAALRRGLI